MLRPFRSVLYLPASNRRAVEKARSLAVDAIIFDLEDAVSPVAKEDARQILEEELGRGGFEPRLKIVRINGYDTAWGAADLEVAARLPCDAVLLPKVNGADDVHTYAAQISKPLWAMVETPLGVLNASEIAAHPRIEALVVGTNDLAKDLNVLPQDGRMPLMTALQMCLLAARAHGVIALDGVYNAFKDEAGLRAECVQGRALGFDGKTLIHPSQLATANEVFAPTAAEIETARRQIEAHDAALAAGQGVAVLDGRIVEGLHIEAARATLAKHAAIATLEKS